jgi:plastocyanin
MLLLISCAAVSAASEPVAKINQSSMAQNYTVLVGGNDSAYNAELQGFFPQNITIHVGDKVTWKQNTMDIHTVTFTGGMNKTPDFIIPVPGENGSLMINPMVAFPAAPADGMYNGSTYANSAVMGPGETQPKNFSLTFTEAGTYRYVCVVHAGENMTGQVTVENASVSVPTPLQASAQGQKELDALRSLTKPLHAEAMASAPKPEQNENGTTTYHVNVGFGQGQVHLEAFFPDKINVHPGDTVVWMLSKSDTEPHTITFLNGAKEPELFLARPQPQGPPLIVFNPQVQLPQNASMPLTDEGVYSSGFLDPTMPGPHTFTLKIGNNTSGTLQFVCLLHDDMNMKGELMVSNKA